MASTSACCSARRPCRSSARSRAARSRQRSCSASGSLVLGEQRQRARHVGARSPRWRTARRRARRRARRARTRAACRRPCRSARPRSPRKSFARAPVRPASHDRRPGVVVAPQAREHGVVGDLVQQLVVEGVFADSVEPDARDAESPARAGSGPGSARWRWRRSRQAPDPRTRRRSPTACCSARFSSGSACPGAPAERRSASAARAWRASRPSPPSTVAAVSIAPSSTSILTSSSM